tara:strand:- start:69 stop:422 length:354 start_codon:yes stop_codon:yes gene_type:complete
MSEYEDFKSRPGELSMIVKGIDLHDKIRWVGWRDQHEAILPLNNIKGERPSYEDFIELLSNITILYYPDDAIREGGRALDGEIWTLDLKAIKKNPGKYFKDRGTSTSFAPNKGAEGE